MIFKFLVVLILLFPPVSLAEDLNDTKSIFEILGINTNEVWDCDWNELNMNKIKPEKVTGSTKNLIAWVDVVGFNKMYKEDNILYYPGDPVNNTVIKYGVSDLLTGSCGVDYITETILIKQINNTVHVVLLIDMKWYETQETDDGEGANKIYHHEYLSVSDTEVLPLEQNHSKDTVTGYIKICNNTFSPKSWIVIKDSNRIKTVVHYKNESIIYYDNVGLIEYNNKGYPYVNLTGEPHPTLTNNELLRRAGIYYCILGTNFSLPDLTIKIHSIYSNNTISNYTVEEEIYEPSNTFHPFLFCFVGVIVVLCIGFYKIRGQYR